MAIRIKIERLPAVRPRTLKYKPETSRDGLFTTEELERLSVQLREWWLDGTRDIPAQPFLSSSHFDLHYRGMFDFVGYEAGAVRLLNALYPPKPHVFLVDSETYCAPRYARVRYSKKPDDDWVYWPGEIIADDHCEQYGGYRGPLDESAWMQEPTREAVEKDVLVMTAYLFARAARTTGYQSRLFYSSPGWPLALRLN